MFPLHVEYGISIFLAQHLKLSIDYLIKRHKAASFDAFCQSNENNAKITKSGASKIGDVMTHRSRFPLFKTASSASIAFTIIANSQE